jgi:hypothetical protein
VAKLVVHGATLVCSKGSAPSKLTVPAVNEVYRTVDPAANVMDMKPNENVSPFGRCQAMADRPCAPDTTSPWSPGSPSVTVGGQPAVSDSCQLACERGGQIQVQSAGQTEVEID